MMASAFPPDRAAGPVPPAIVGSEDASLGQLFSEMTAQLGSLVRQEIELAKVETKEEVSHAAKAAGLLIGAGLTALMAWLFVSLALAWLLDQWLNRSVAFVVVGLLYGVVAAVLFVTGKAGVKRIDPVPRQTVETLKEDAQWAKAQKS